MYVKSLLRRSLWSLSLCFCLTAFAAAVVQADDPVKLLEKAIYLEETVGKLDEAIKGYQTVIAASKESIDSAAQAQFRIASCLAKQGKTQESNAAFQAVVDNYSQATVWVNKAKEQLPGEPKLLPVPWGDGDELHMDITLPNGMAAGRQVFRVSKVAKDGRDYWQCDNWQMVTLNGMVSRSRVDVDFESFKPIRSTWTHTLLGQADATYDQDKVTVEVAGKEKPVVLKLDKIMYDNEQCAEVLRRLPLEVGFQAEVTAVSTLVAQKVPITVSVDKKETIETPAGKFECFKIDFSIGQSFWVSSDKHRYIVRFEAGGVAANLTKVRTVQLNEKTQLDSEFVSATLPPLWHAYTPVKAKSGGTTVTHLIDSAAALDTKLISGPIDKTKKKHASPKAWLEYILEQQGKQGKHMKDFAVSDAGFKAITVDGHQGAVVQVEFTDGDKKMVGRSVAVFGKTSAVNLRFKAEKDVVEKWQPAIDEIIASLKLK